MHAQVRTLLANLATNETLRFDLLCGFRLPRDVARATPEELANVWVRLQRQSSQQRRQQQLEAAERAACAHEEHLQSVQARGRALLESQDRDLTAPVVYSYDAE